MTIQQSACPDGLSTASLQVHAGVRLRPPEVAGEPWRVQHLTAHANYAVSARVAWLILAFIGGARVADVLDESVRTGAERAQMYRAVGALCADQVLVDEAEGVLHSATAGTHMWAMTVMRQWAHAGWHAAADYHIATFDYPAVSYQEGAAADAALMREYTSVEPDLNRTKKYPDALDSRPAPAAGAALGLLQRPFDEVWEECCGRPRGVTSHQVNQADVLTLCGAVFGQLRSRDMKSAGRAPLIRKINPSGGARHPTEAYVVSVDVLGLPRGVYHFAVSTNTLDRIADAPADAQLELLFDGLYRARHERSFEPRALFILTSVFDRNMYRYREPRTFRTVFMDVGCAVTNLELIARSFGYSMYTHNAMDDTRTEELLGIDGLSEGLIYGAAIGVYQQ